jgi:hypothetical protein
MIFLRWLGVALCGAAIMMPLYNSSVRGWTATVLATLGMLTMCVFAPGLMLWDELTAATERAYALRSRAFDALKPQPALERFMAETIALHWTILDLPAGVVQAIAAAVIRDGLPFTMRGMPITRAEFVQARNTFMTKGWLLMVGRGHRFNREGRIFLLKVYTGQVKPSATSPTQAQGADALRLVTRALPTHSPGAHGGGVV